MIDPESLYFRGTMQVLFALFQVPDPERLEACLKRHPDLSRTLLETHHLARQVFDFGFPFSLEFFGAGDIIYVSFGTPSDIDPDTAEHWTERLLEDVKAISGPDSSLLDFSWIPNEDPDFF